MQLRRMAPAALLLALAGAVRLSAQDAALVARVTGAPDHAPVASARLQLMSAARTTRTDASGIAILSVPSWPDTVLVTAIGFASARVALRAAPDRALELQLVTAPVVLPDLVTTAGRRVQRMADATSSVTVLARHDIDVTGAGGLDPVVAETPGLQLASRISAGATVQIRGLGDARVLVMVDGEPVPGSQLENRDLSRISTADVERIEITKGPTSLQHGSDALGGVSNVVTRRAEGPLALDIRGLAGDEGRRSAGIGLSRGGTLAFRLSGNLRQEERVAGLTQRRTALERVWGLRSTTQVHLRSDLSLRADVSYFRTRQRWPVSSTFAGFVDTWQAGGFIEGVLDRSWGTTTPAGGPRLRRAPGWHSR